METFSIVLFLGIFSLLLTLYIMDWLRGEQYSSYKSEHDQSWLIPLILGALVVHGYISWQQEQELQGSSLEDIHSFVQSKGYFPEDAQWDQWIGQQQLQTEQPWENMTTYDHGIDGL